MASKVIISPAYFTPPVSLYEEEDVVLQTLGFSEQKHFGPIDVEYLPISEELQKEIMEWDQVYQNTFSPSNPLKSGFGSEEDKNIHRVKGEYLANQVQAELGEKFKIEYKK